MTPPVLSVVMPNYNHARFIERALDSVLSQSLRPAEIIVVDDGSTDDSVEVIGRIAARAPEVRLVRNERNMGVFEAENRGVALARGHFLAFMAADDVLVQGLYEKSVAILQRHPTAALCSARLRVIDEDDQEVLLDPRPVPAWEPCHLPPQRVMELLRREGSWLSSGTCVYRREMFVAAGGLHPELKNYADSFITRVLAIRHGVCYLPEVLGSWRQMSSGFARSSQANIDGQVDVVRHFRRLLAAPPYAQMVPPDYARAWAREWGHGILGGALDRFEAQAGALVEKNALDAWPDRLFRVLSRAALFQLALVQRAFHFFFLRKEGLGKALRRKWGGKPG